MITTVTGKNQITIPAALARKLKIEPGQRIDWQIGPDGVLIAQISNHHLDLRPVIWKIGQALGLTVVSLQVMEIPENHSEALPSQFIALSRNPALFEVPEIAAAADRMENFSSTIRLWTDDYSNLFQVLK